MINFRDLVAAGLHYGHQASRWNPAMEPYIWGEKNQVHLIDVSKTAFQLEKAAKFLESVAAQGKPILWIGTKKAAQNTVKARAIGLNNPFVTHRWIGGTLTNFPQVKKSVTKLLHYEDILEKSEQYPYTKKELNTLQKISRRLEANVGGIRNLQWPVAAVVIVDIKKEHAAMLEAATSGVPIVALVDTNVDPALIDYVIPGNDDAPKAIKLIVDYLADAAERGYEVAKKEAAAKKAEAKAQKDAKDLAKTKEAEADMHAHDDAELSEEEEEVEVRKSAKPKVKKMKAEQDVVEEKKDTKKSNPVRASGVKKAADTTK